MEKTEAISKSLMSVYVVLTPWEVNHRVNQRSMDMMGRARRRTLSYSITPTEVEKVGGCFPFHSYLDANPGGVAAPGKRDGPCSCQWQQSAVYSKETEQSAEPNKVP